MEAADFLCEKLTWKRTRNLPEYKKTPGWIISIIPEKNENKAFKVEKYEHTYSTIGWRTDKTDCTYPMDSWVYQNYSL